MVKYNKKFFMYIIEIIAKFILKRKTANNYKPDLEESEFLDDYKNCKHIYIAIDSTKDYLACNKCGNVIKNTKEFKNKPEEKNFFKM